ncbi:carbohydrate ABC transporter permease [Paenibacillus radicis (ex Xue et al. 2023)]|uniref:Carbohydrate ABC transporter permease n=1 Tax=Paenibacillus radicis (ex Xue et al. 2023) TaxID=2972489 RepID=A0ABT1YHK9_9BACL|nr:carbohydrate ABC transporter permease [Paenibacillus radicis (ex Xue et al. 2023)]MCR8632679.1 carbohydrate ABC transporter permease [Paenibacillus radicis (ex Xue et al. 2023)]
MNKLSFGQQVGRSTIYIVLSLIAVLTLFPFLYVIIISITPESEVIRRGIVLIPEQITFNAYKSVFNGGSGIWGAYQITLFRTIVGTMLNLVFTVLGAYVLSKKALPGRSGLLMFVVFTMLFSGGLIPTYIVVRSLELTNTVWALIVPGLVSVFNLVVVKGFFEQLPVELEESAKVDGAGELKVLVQIILPLSLPSIATIGLFYAVGHWNSYFDAVIYINKSSLMPLQVILRNILLSSQNQQNLELINDATVSSLAIQMASVIVSTVPILCVYPFIQKHFTKGVMIGAVKG